MGKRAKRNVKDSVFVMLFQILEYALQLYLSLHPEDSTVTEADCQLLTLKTILVNGIYNDFGMLVRDKLIILVEAQSTFSKNLAARVLLYFAETLNRYVENQKLNLYSGKKITIPRPEFYMVYVGPEQDLPAVIRLSDLYPEAAGGEQYAELQKKYGGLDLEIKVLRGTGKGDILDQYVSFCRIANQMRKRYGNTLKAVRAAIEKCLSEGILTAFLTSRQEEVQEAMMVLYNEEVIRRNYEHELRQEGRREGRQEERKHGIRALIATLKELSQSKDTAIQMVAKQFHLQPQAAAEQVALYW